MILMEREEGAIWLHDERPIDGHYYAEQEMALLAKEVATHFSLTPRQCDLLACKLAGASTLTECGELMGVTPERARVLNQWAMMALRRWVRRCHADGRV